ncbi:MAG: PD-(D/E)XK nuclease family protein [Saprospiraceae bacterium]|nr:PD-(D/E)XK nuclease family protein [Saprospiraceae bacterium]
MLYTIFFGLNYDSGVYPRPDTEGGHLYLGEKNLLRWFELHLGLSGHKERIEHIRVEQYRQALRRYVKNNPTVFFHKSFEADALACAEALLQRRDELLLSGYDFAPDTAFPPRLKVLVDVEHLFLRHEDGSSKLVAGEADRFEAVIQTLKNKKAPLETLVVNEIDDNGKLLLPPQYKRLLEALELQGVDIVSQQKHAKWAKLPRATQYSNDLQIFKNFVSNQLPRGQKQLLKADGSLIVIESERDTEGADFLSKVLSLNPDFRPAFLIPDRNRTLDEALIQNGLPAFGLPSASLGRPALQLLKLVTAFIWQPLDLYKILEFVSMPIKPLDNDLGTVIGNIIAQRPGINSELWHASTDQFFEDLEVRAKQDMSINVKKVKEQFEFWFKRAHYDITKAAPRDEITKIFTFLKDWAIETHGNGKNPSLLVLAEQARRIEEFLYELPPSETFLSYLDLERIIRTIYEPSPVSPRPQEVRHYPFVAQGDCLLQPVSKLVWWNFTDTEGVHFFSRWYADEVAFLKGKNIVLQSPQDENALMLWQRVQPVLRTTRHLILVYPKKINGEDAAEHPLCSHLRACFGDLTPITVHTKENWAAFEALAHLDTPQHVRLKPHRLGKIEPIIAVQSPLLTKREHETPTSLESLFYYPYQWVFRHKAKLNKSSILSIVKENTLKGNLSHRFFELILKENFQNWTQRDVNDWIDDHQKLLSREAATLLMYGFEPQKLQLLRQIKNAIWTLIEHIRRNKWEVEQTEKELFGVFADTPIKGKADVVLLRGSEKCVLDLKWSGHTRRERMIKNGEDLQLVMYARLLNDSDEWAHTGYFIIENARLLARNTAAFAEIKPLTADDAFAVNDVIWQKMLTTYDWRLKQVAAGQIEIRTAKTIRELEEHYGMTLLDVLEMKNEDAKYDDYGTLIGLVK